MQLAAASASLSGRFTVTDAPAMALWDDGASSWIDPRPDLPPPTGAPSWRYIPPVAMRGAFWDTDEPSQWDGGATTYTDELGGWDMPTASGHQTYVIGKAGPFGANLTSKTGLKMTARVHIIPPDPRNPAQIARRTKHAQAVAAWHANANLCTATAIANRPGHYWSHFHRWIAHFHKTH